jgi:hypothetical protein
VQTSPYPAILDDENYSAPFANQLKLVALLRNFDPMQPDAVLRESQPFSVAAIPIAMKVTQAQREYGEQPQGLGLRSDQWVWGVHYSLAAVSDSGTASDLDEVYITERILARLDSGLFLTLVRANSEGDYNRASSTQHDHNGLVMRGATRDAARTALQVLIRADPGFSIYDQFWEFAERRTGVGASLTTSIAVKASGYGIYEEARTLTRPLTRSPWSWFVSNRLPEGVQQVEKGLYPNQRKLSLAI